MVGQEGVINFYDLTYSKLESFISSEVDSKEPEKMPKIVKF